MPPLLAGAGGVAGCAGRLFTPVPSAIWDLGFLTRVGSRFAVTQLEPTAASPRKEPSAGFSYFGRWFFSVGCRKDSGLLSGVCPEPIGNAGILIISGVGM